MDQATQQNAALVEQSAPAADSLKTQAGALVQAVSVFKLAHGAQTHAAPATVAPQERSGAERRSPARAKNVTRPPFGKKSTAKHEAVESVPVAAAPLKTGTNDEWASF